jgi:hypothetical protein
VAIDTYTHQLIGIVVDVLPIVVVSTTLNDIFC